MQSSASVNLIKEKINIWDEILKWALSVGRLLVILTELVAFTTFIYRFTLDRTLIDLHSKINQEQAIVVSLKGRETLYRNIQERLFIISKVSESGSKNANILQDVVDLTPNGISFNSIEIVNNKIKIDSNVQSVSALSKFTSQLRKYEETSSVSIEKIENQSLSNKINVQILVILKSS